MKVLVILMVLVIAVVALVVKFGGVMAFDPAAGVEDFMENVKPGQTWQQVLDVKTPRKYFIMREDKEGFVGPGPEIRFDADKFATRMQANAPARGFMFKYAFDTENIYDVYFDAAGTVTSIEKPMTMGDLLGR